MILKNVSKKIICFTAAFVLAVGLLPSFSARAATLYEAGYDFEDRFNLKWDMSGNYPLVDFSFDPLTPKTGHTGNGVSAFFQSVKECNANTVDNILHHQQRNIGIVRQRFKFSADYCGAFFIKIYRIRSVV